jgi:hypothetical protein
VQPRTEPSSQNCQYFLLSKNKNNLKSYNAVDKNLKLSIVNISKYVQTIFLPVYSENNLYNRVSMECSENHRYLSIFFFKVR